VRSASATSSSRRHKTAIARRAFILGGTGNVGGATARALAADGWDVTVAARHPASEAFDFVSVDRDEESALEVANGFDLIVDVIPYEPAHAEQLLALEIGAIVAISSASVYADEQGRTLDEAQRVDDFPDFPVPIPETQATVAGGDQTYSTKKAKLERILLESGRVPAAVVRPCAIYGRGDCMAREWFFLKRALDRRRFVVLANRGAGHFHTTASQNIGELVRLIAAKPRTDVFNCGDPDPPTVLDLVRAIGEAAGHRFVEVLLPDPAGRGEVGQTPWSVPTPLLVDMTKASRELGYRPATSWAEALPRQVEWLIEATRDRDWREVLPGAAEYLRFDYQREDELLADLAEARLIV
jgi:nucleoside-diphosphate-sugar epimerase